MLGDITAADEIYIVTGRTDIRKCIQFFAELFYMLYFYLISIKDFYIIKQFTLSHKISKFIQKFCLVYCYCILPD